MAIANYFQFNVLTQPDPNNPEKTNIQIQPGAHGLFSGGIVMDLVVGVDSVTAQSLQTTNAATLSPVTVKGLLDTGDGGRLCLDQK